MSENNSGKVNGNSQQTSPPGAPSNTEYVRKDRATNGDQGKPRPTPPTRHK